MASQTSYTRTFLTRLAGLDPALTVLTAVLLGVGCLFIYGTGQQIGGRFEHYWIRQLLWLAVGVIGFVLVAVVDYRRIGVWSIVFYAAGLASLAAVLVFGQEINNARSWFRVWRFTVQPAEFAKPSTILFLAWLASRRGVHLSRSIDLVLFAILASLPLILIARQPDWGTALVFVPLALAIAFVAGLPWRFILCGAVLAAVTGPLAYQLVLGERQKERIQTFFNPAEDISDAGWNAHQSLLAVGSGGTFGKGFMRGTQHVLGYLPKTVAPTDFIFSVIGEEAGLVGAGALVCAFLGILICCLRAAALAPDSFGTCICAGAAGMIFAHMYVNIGMTVRAAPIIGIPLPLVSYGGSFMLSTMALLGLVQSVYIRRNKEP